MSGHVGGSAGGSPALRDGSPRDADALLDLERRTNTVALAHVFDPARHAFPSGDVRLRWERLLEDPDADVVVADGSGRVDGVVAVGGGRVGHLLVDPGLWGTGLSSTLLDAGLERLRRTGVRRAELTCLVDNARARAFYAKQGFAEARSDGRAPWPPYPRQLLLVRDLAV